MQAEDSAISDEGESQFDVAAERLSLVAACDGQATQAIHNQFPPHKQLNIISRGGAKKLAMDAFIDSVIAHSRNLKVQLEQAGPEQLASIDLYRGWPEFDPAPPPEPEPDPEPDAPESHFADLMLADETAEDAKVRLTEKLKLLRHYLMAPEIKVNADGSFGLLKDEQDELKDLERRQAQGRWLDA